MAPRDWNVKYPCMGTFSIQEQHAIVRLLPIGPQTSGDEDHHGPKTSEEDQVLEPYDQGEQQG